MTSRRAGPKRLISVVMTAVLAPSLASCGASNRGHLRQGEERPAAALTSSLEAQAAFRPLLKRFAQSTETERVALEPELVRFRFQFASDPLARSADALLALIALWKNDLNRAAALAESLEDGDAGTIRDESMLVHGAVLRRRGNVAEALEHLRPLVGKLIDPWALSLLSSEITQAALGARRWDEAVRYMTTWLRRAGEDEKAAVHARVAKLLEAIPPPALVTLFEASRARGTTGGQAATEMHELMAQRLALLAREQKDVQLAKRLLSTSGELLGSEGDAVAELAVGSGGERIEGRTVGLMLSLRTDETRRRGLEVAAGLAQGLGLPGSAARLVSRDDRGSPEHVVEALESLASEGAAVFVGGIDEEEATALAAFARAHRMPAILLRPPKPAPNAPDASGDLVFVLGDAPADTSRALATALQAAGADPIAVLGDGFLEVQLAPAVATAAGAPARKPLIGNACGDAQAPAAWKRLGVQGLVLNGPPACVRDALAAAQESVPRARLALGFDAGQGKLPNGALVAAAGAYPIEARTANASVRAWLGSGRAPPSWWAGLGHDAGVLAWAALQALPDKSTEERKEVQARREAAAKALRTVTAELWTTEATGFAGANVITRRISAKRADAP